MEKHSIEVTKNELGLLNMIREVRERAKGGSKDGDSSETTTAQGKEYGIKVDADDVLALFKVVRTIEDLSIETEWATDYLIAYDRIRDQIKEEVIG